MDLYESRDSIEYRRALEKFYGNQLTLTGIQSIIKEWDEDDHPRGEDGKFVSSGGGISATGENKPPKGFSSKQKEIYHYNKHVIKENAKIYQGMTQNEYIEHAKKFLSQSCSDDIDGYMTEDGAICRFNKATGEYAKGYPDGNIKTCMVAKCNPKTGEANLSNAQKYFDHWKSEEGSK
ncbi:MAG: hypothetical protein LUG91_01070 [Ruminococcus sp.]|nr:hypothetical protein [Ruminococcus sp.]